MSASGNAIIGRSGWKRRRCDMKFSMNGFRRSFSCDVRKLRDVSKNIIEGELYDTDDFIEAVNEVIRHSNVINCVYQKDDPNFIEMSDLEVGYLDDQTRS
jgi:hypothetical protein